MQKILLLLISLSLFSSQFVNAKDVHNHNGKLEPYTGEPPRVELLDEEKSLLDSDKAVFKKITLGKSKRGIAIFRVNASAKTVWSVIRDFSSYPQWIKDIKNTELYKEVDGLHYVRFTASGGLLGDKNWFVVHDYADPDKLANRNWGTWKLDYNHRSDIDGSVGFWRVIPIQDVNDQVYVVYSADLRLKGFLGSLFEGKFIDSSLKEATQWVKLQAELQAKTNQ